MKWLLKVMWAVCVASWGLLILDAMPWGWDLAGGSDGIVRIIALLATAGLWVERDANRPAHEIYQAGVEEGLRRAARQAAEREVGERRFTSRGSLSAAAAVGRVTARRPS